MTNYDASQHGTTFRVYDVTETPNFSSNSLRFVIRHNGKAWEAHTMTEKFNYETNRFERKSGDPITIQTNDRYDYDKIASMLGIV